MYISTIVYTFDISITQCIKDMKSIINENLIAERKEPLNTKVPESIKARLAKTSRLRSLEMDADISMNDLVIYFLDNYLPTLEELESKSVA